MSARRRVVAQQVARAAAAAGFTASRAKASQPLSGMVSASQIPQEVTIRSTVTGEQWCNRLEVFFQKWLDDRNSVSADCDVFFSKLLKRFPIAAAAREALNKVLSYQPWKIF